MFCTRYWPVPGLAFIVVSAAFWGGEGVARQQSGKAMIKQASGISYQPVGYGDLEGWDADDHLAAFKAFARSCVRLIATVNSGGRTGATPTPVALLGACDEAKRLGAGKMTRKAARAFFEFHFTPHAVVHKGPRSILTGYYEPELSGSRTKQGRFQIPIYKRPPELVNLVSEADRAGVGKGLTHARRTKTGLVPFAKRAAIEQGHLKGRGLELLYLADPVDAFFMHIEGSGRITLRDGSAIRISYDGKNGHPYSSVGRHLIKQGVIGAKSMSMGALGKWLKADAERGRKTMWINESYIFFRELKGAEAAGAHGVMSIPLTAGRSLAIDTRYHAMGLPIYVSARGLRHVHKTRGFHRLMVAQDVGSAIKGPERGDIFFGSGARAARLAGVTKEPGKFYVLLPRKALPETDQTRSRVPAAAPSRRKTRK